MIRRASSSDNGCFGLSYLGFGFSGLPSLSDHGSGRTLEEEDDFIEILKFLEGILGLNIEGLKCVVEVRKSLFIASSSRTQNPKPIPQFDRETRQSKNLSGNFVFFIPIEFSPNNYLAE